MKPDWNTIYIIIVLVLTVIVLFLLIENNSKAIKSHTEILGNMVKVIDKLSNTCVMPGDIIKYSIDGKNIEGVYVQLKDGYWVFTQIHKPSVWR